MPKPLKKKSATLPKDVNQRAHRLVEMSTREPEPEPDFKAQLSAYMAELGRKGGTVSGAKRMEMPKKQRVEIARKANAARWAKKKAV